MGGCYSGNILTIKVLRAAETSSCFSIKNSEGSKVFYLEPCLHPFKIDIMEAMTTISQKWKSHPTFYRSQNIYKMAKSLTLPSKWKIEFSIFLIQTWATILERTTSIKLEWCLEKRLHKSELSHDFSCIHSFMMYTDPIENKNDSDRKSTLLLCFPFAHKSWRKYNHWTVHELPDD